MRKFTLTGNDIALAQQGIGLALAWWRTQDGNSDFRRQNIAALKVLKAKLSAISDHVYPYEHSDDMPLSVGDELIMRLDSAVSTKTRRAAIRAGMPFRRTRACQNC